MSKYLDSLVKNLDTLLAADKRRKPWLADKTGTPVSTIYKIFNKEREPSIETLEAIESGLNLQPGDLLKDELKTSLKKADLLALVARLDDDQIDEIAPSVRGLLGEATPDELELSPKGRLK